MKKDCNKPGHDLCNCTVTLCNSVRKPAIFISFAQFNIWFISYAVIVVLNFLSFPILARWRAGRIWSFYRWRRIWGISAICLVFVSLVPWPRSCSVLTFKSSVVVTVLDKSLKPRKGIHYFQPIHVKCEHCEKLQTLGDFPLPPLPLCSAKSIVLFCDFYFMATIPIPWI